MGENKYLSFEEFYRRKYPEGYSYAMKSRSKNQTFGGYISDGLKEMSKRNLLARLKRKDPSLFSEKGFNELEKKVMKDKKMRGRLEAIKIFKKSKKFRGDEEDRLYDSTLKLLYGDLSEEDKAKYSSNAVKLFVKALNLGVIKCPRYSPGKEFEQIYKRVPELFKNKNDIKFWGDWLFRSKYQPELEKMGDDIKEAKRYAKNVEREIDRLRRINRN